MRYIDEIIVHCTATFRGQDVDVQVIRDWHVGQGWNDIGYHFVIEENGSIVAGRPIELIGAHCAGRNKASIGVVYVGGLGSDGKPKDTRTMEQKESMKRLIVWLVWKFGISRVAGHRDYSNKACPCFDAKKEYQEYVDWMYRDAGYYEESVHGEYYLRPTF